MIQKPTYEEMEKRVENLEEKATRQLDAEYALRESERRIRNLLDFVPYPIVVFTLDGLVNYLNPSFTEIFGWTFEELKGKTIPYTPPGREQEPIETIRKLRQGKTVLRHETKRRTKDGRILDVVLRAVIYSEAADEPTNALVILRDITREKRDARNNEAMLRISLALPRYTDLDGLLDYISSEVQQLLNSEGALVISLDEKREELFFLGASYIDPDIQKRIKDFRFTLDQLVAGRVIKTGEPIIVSDISEEPELHLERDKKLGYVTRNLLLVPLKTHERTIGVLCAINKKDGDFETPDVELLEMIAGTVALSVENARVTEELKKSCRNNEALLRISLALPEYPDLKDLHEYINNEIKRLLGSEGALVILLDEKREELYFLSVSYEDPAIEKRVKEFRFTMDQLVAGRVIKSGKPIIVSDTSKEPRLHRERDQKLGYHTRNLLLVPLKGHGKTFGALCALNKKAGDFEQVDMELLEMIAGTVALSVENARVSEELKRAYREVTTLNRAKDKAINHLSHELKTPISVIIGALQILEKNLSSLPDQTWKRTMERSRRNLHRLIEIQGEVNDIMLDRHHEGYPMLSRILDQFTDELGTLIDQEVGDVAAMERIRKQLEDILGPKEENKEEILLDAFVKERLKTISSFFSHRRVEIISCFESTPPVYMPPDPLRKVVDGLIKNAVENTPDEGKIEIFVRKHGEGTQLIVRDYGVGIVEESQRRIFEGFFPTGDTADYSSKRPFDFNAGGKGADLLRMKIFSERYHFKIDMESTRCRFIPSENDECPGTITKCSFCHSQEDCYASGGTCFYLYFPPARE